MFNREKEMIFYIFFNKLTTKFNTVVMNIKIIVCHSQCDLQKQL